MTVHNETDNEPSEAELALGRALSERGYLVCFSPVNYRPGDKTTGGYLDDYWINHPFHVLGETDIDDFIVQFNILNHGVRTFDQLRKDQIPPVGHKYYRVSTD